MSQETRHGELAKIHALADGNPYRVEVLETLAILKERSEQSQNWQHGTDAWRAMHDRQDAESFVQIRAEIQAIKASVGGVSSGVNDYRDDKAQLSGARKLFIGAVAVVGGIGASVIFFIEVAKYFFSKQP